MKLGFALLAFGMLGGLIAGCASSPPPAPARPEMASVNVPVITPQKETQQAQEKGGLQITVAPYPYQARVAQSVRVAQRPRSTGEELWGGPHMQEIPVRRTTTSQVQVYPETLCFLVTVYNKMPRVFHGGGTVVQFNVGGQVLAVNQSGYANLINAIIPPQQQQQIVIQGPPLSELGSGQGILGVFIYDVVTQQNDAGVVTEKQNYKWFFDFALAPRTVEVPATSTEDLYMSQMEYQQAMMAQNLPQQQQAYRAAMQGQAGSMNPYAPPPGPVAPGAAAPPTPAAPGAAAPPTPRPVAPQASPPPAVPAPPAPAAPPAAAR